MAESEKNSMLIFGLLIILFVQIFYMYFHLFIILFLLFFYPLFISAVIIYSCEEPLSASPLRSPTVVLPLSWFSSSRCVFPVLTPRPRFLCLQLCYSKVVLWFIVFVSTHALARLLLYFFIMFINFFICFLLARLLFSLYSS